MERNSYLDDVPAERKAKEERITEELSRAKVQLAIWQGRVEVLKRDLKHTKQGN